MPSRTSLQITKSFERFPLNIRKQVKTISLDLNAGYINLIPKLFSNTKVVVDRFHIVQMVSTAPNMVRVQVMKAVPQYSKEYRFMKQAWKVFLKRFEELDVVKQTYHISVGYFDISVNLISKCLDLDPHFRATYEVYQAVLTAIKERDLVSFKHTLDDYENIGNRMDQSIKSLKKYRSKVLKALLYDHSNGFLGKQEITARIP